MLYQGLAIVLAVLALFLGLLGIKRLFNKTWLTGFFIGLVGCALIALASVVALSAMQVMQFHSVERGQQLATVSIRQIGAGKKGQAYQLSVFEPASNRNWDVVVEGDQWQLDARVFRWSRYWEKLGLAPGYQLDRLSGRFFTYQTHRDNNSHRLQKETPLFDFWQLLQTYRPFEFLEAHYSSATFIPLADGAIYGLYLQHSGLKAEAINQEAKAASNL